MEKQVIRSPLVPETGGPFNLAVRHGCYVYISGLPPFEEDYCRQLRQARVHNLPFPAFPDIPFEQQRLAPSSVLVADGTSLASQVHRPPWQRCGVKTPPSPSPTPRASFAGVSQG